MLVLSRKVGEKLVIGNDIWVTVVAVKGHSIELVSTPRMMSPSCGLKSPAAKMNRWTVTRRPSLRPVKCLTAMVMRSFDWRRPAPARNRISGGRHSKTRGFAVRG